MHRYRQARLYRQALSRSLRSTVSWPAALLLAISCLGAAAIGCEDPARVSEADAATGAVAASESSASDSSAATADAASEKEQAVSISLATWEEIREAAKGAGQPTVLDVWSLSCEPCLKEFPGLVRLEEQWGDRLHCVSANIDFDGRKTRPPESYQDKALSFLQQKKASLANYLCTTPSDEVYEELKIASIPAVLVFDAEGKEVARFVDAGATLGFTYEEDVMPFVRGLLENSAASADGE